MTSRARDDWIERARAARIEDVIEERGGLKLRKTGREMIGPCPVCCDGHDRFAVHLDKQVFNCRRCGGKGGDAIALVCFLDACGFLDAVETLAGPPPNAARETDAERVERERLGAERRDRLEREKIEREEREAAERRIRIADCDRLWRETVRLPPDAVAYFARRGIVLDDVPENGGLRFHARCPFDGPILPCVVGRFTDAATGAPGGIWRRPINGAKPKAYGPMSGHVIRLWADAEVTNGLCIGEGVETVLAASQIAHCGTLLRPAWACGCAHNIEKFLLLPGVEYLTVLADADRSGKGQSAARVCAKRWAGAGREVEVLIPDMLGQDFNDLVVRAAS